MVTVAQLSKGFAKVALATVFTGPLAGAREAGVQAVELASSRDGGTAEKRVLDQIENEVKAVAAGQGIDPLEARSAVETAEDIFLRHALTQQELVALQLDPGRAARELIRRGGTELRRLGQDADLS